MFTRIRIRRFRGIEDLTLPDLKRINIITGENGSGKSSVLEAAFALGGAANAHITISLFGFRNDTRFTPGADRMFKGLFRNLDPNKSIELEADGDFRRKFRTKGRRLSITQMATPTPIQGSTAETRKMTGLQFECDGPSGKYLGTMSWTTPFQIPSPTEPAKTVSLKTTVKDNPDLILAHYVSPFRELWEQAHQQLTVLTKTNKVKDVVEQLRMVDPRLQNLLPLIEDDVPTIYADIGASTLVPVSLQGSGFTNVMHIVLDTFALSNGMLMIDEIEDGLHHTVLDKLISYLFIASELNRIQIFITTHSDEMLERFALLARAKRFDDLALFRISRDGEATVASSYSTDDLISSRESNLELR